MKTMKAKNPVMVKAGQKAAATRKANKEALEKKLSDAGKKAWETRRFNAFLKSKKISFNKK